MIGDAERVARMQRQLAAFGSARSPLNQQIGRMRIVVAGSQIYEIPNAWTFHEFLMSYGLAQLGKDWLMANMHNHPIAIHLDKGIVGIRLTGDVDGNFFATSMNGDLFAFLSFAYDLFTLADNAEVQKSLFERVRKVDQYQGARYEMFVGASLLRAGFKLAFEDESDSRVSHCEFTATNKQTNRSFSVEAKSRHRGEAASDDETALEANMYRLIQKALAKNASYERIIFADVNLPSDNKPATLNQLEHNQRESDPWPQAIIFFTNRKTSPWPIESTTGTSTVLMTAINHPLFKDEANKDALAQGYPEIGTLFRAVNELSRPPSHFFAQ